MTVYLDTSALAKLVIVEAETEALRQWLAAHSTQPRATNVIGVVELRRLAARVGQRAMSAATTLLSRVDQLDLTPRSLAVAAQLPPPEVRTLDALHVGSAAEFSDLSAIITYDLRMSAAASGYGLPVLSPGVE